MTNCKNCGAPIDIYAEKCPWCGSPYEMSSDEVERKRQKAYKDAIKVMQMYGSEWDFDDDYAERAARYSRGEKLKLKYVDTSETVAIKTCSFMRKITKLGG